jgi:DeoR family fructose operon transcriptional repressor
VSVAELARAHAVSPITVHRDLEALAAEGLVERVHGGARAVDGFAPPASATPAIATAWVQRVGLAGRAKEHIAARAAGLVENGATIFVDASSSAWALAQRLVAEPPNELTLVTNSPAIAYELQADSIHVIVSPGELDQHMRMIAGRWTVEFLAELNFSHAFVSCAGLNLDQGLTTSRRPLADVVNAARASAAQTVALVDATKFGRASLLTIMGAQEPDLIITDGALPDAEADAFTRAGVALEVLGAGAAT